MIRERRMTSEELAYAVLIKACTRKKEFQTATKLHAEIHKRGLLQKSLYLGDSLITMYTKIGMHAKAELVFEQLSTRSTVSWNALIAGYAQQGRCRHALNCLEQMKKEGLSPNIVTFTCILNACSKIGAIEQGSEIHEKIVNQDLVGKDIVLDNTLVNMYAKCGALEKARDVLDGLPVRNATTWTPLIVGFSQQGKYHESLDCIERMQGEGLSPDAVIFTCILKSCGKSGAIDKGRQIHDTIVCRGLLEKDVVLGNALVLMYALCGMLQDAQEVLEWLPIRNVNTWNALITGYAYHGHSLVVLHCFERMYWEGLSPDVVTITCALNACGKLGNIIKGKQIHDEIISTSLLRRDVALGNALVDMYAKCGLLARGQEVLEELHIRDVVSWSTLIIGYTQQGQGHKALICFEWMRNEGLHPDAITFSWILKACGMAENIGKGKEIHNEILQRGLLVKDTTLGNALVDMYTKCGALLNAREVLEELPVRSVVSWSALIAGYAQQGQCHEALRYFDQMLNEGLSPDAVTFICVLRVCGCLGVLDKGKQIHEEIVNRGWLANNVALATAIMDMYMKCGALSNAEEILEEHSVRCVISWSMLISGLTKHGRAYEALTCFEQMRCEGILPDVITYACILKTCAITGAIEKGQQIHDEINSRNLFEQDAMVGNSLLDMYIKWGMLEKAHQLLEKLPIRDEISWSSMILGCIQQEQGHEALNCYQRMQNEGQSPNVVTYICILKACSATGSIDKGKRIHGEIFSRGLLTKDIMLGTALIDMYAKCGKVAKAKKLLEELPARNLVSWNALLGGCAQEGQGREALIYFEQMQNEGLSPDAITFLCVLAACGHSGLLDNAQMLFTSMTKNFGIVPNLEHYTCMIVVYGSAGHFDKAISIIKNMPSSDYTAVWLSLMGVCRKWGNVKLGGLAFDQAVQLDDTCAAAYTLMTDIYLAAGLHDDAGKVEAMKLKYGKRNSNM